MWKQKLVLKTTEKEKIYIILKAIKIIQERIV